MRTSSSTKKNLAQSRIPRVSTRGYYDLSDGRTLKKKSYDLYPKRFFEEFDGSEITVMIHGLRNNKSGALAKFAIAKRRLGQLGYRHDVVGFTYDSNVRGAHLKSCEETAIAVGKIIAKKNGANLAKFIVDFKKQHPDVKVRLMGHSLGSEVILHALANLVGHRGIVEGAYFFGGSAPANSFGMRRGRMIQATLRQRLLNYYSPQDEVLKYAYENNLAAKPVGYEGADGKTVPKYAQKRVRPKNHRFASYAAVLMSYP